MLAAPLYLRLMLDVTADVAVIVSSCKLNSQEATEATDEFTLIVASATSYCGEP